MSEPKPLASLSASLLARKGAARPAMRRQTALGVAAGFGGHDDLGWNDMGYDVDPQNGGPGDHQPTSSGLSPMSRIESDADVRSAIDTAIDNAIDGAVIAPIDGISPVPSVAETPPVVTVQADLARAMAPEMPPATPPAVPNVVVEIPVAPTIIARPVQPVVRLEQNRARSAAGTKGAFAFTLRLDPERHLRLRLASATGNRSAQQILTTLLDDYLANQPDIDAFANRLGMAN